MAVWHMCLTGEVLERDVLLVDKVDDRVIDADEHLIRSGESAAGGWDQSEEPGGAVDVVPAPGAEQGAVELPS